MARALSLRPLHRRPTATGGWPAGSLVDPEDVRPRGLSHILLVTIAAFFFSFLAWASWATLDIVTRGNGKVIPSRQVQVVQHLEGGIVSEILTAEGDTVEKGQVLMRIDNVRAASDYREKKSRYLAVLAAIARLEAEIRETAIQFPEEVLREARDIAESERALFRSRQEKLDSQLSILRQQVQQREQELKELKSRLSQVRESYRLAKEELDFTAPLAKQRLVSKTELLRLKRQVNDLKGELEQTRLSIERAESAVREARQRIAEAVSQFRSDALRELSNLKSELAGLREVVEAGADRVRRTEVRSPVKGIVKKLHVNTIGGVVAPGQDLVEIVPLEDTLLVEAHIRPSDIAFLHPGQKAKVKITAYDYSIYGGLEGEVEHISADTITDERGNSYFLIRVRTDRNHLGSDDKPLPIIPGMTAEVDILTGHKTVLEYLLKPLIKARERALTER